MRIEDYGVIGDAGSLALISREGSIDWLCWPQFHSPSVFARLLDGQKGGYCRLSPVESKNCAIHRSYLPDTAILETIYESATGKVRVVDFMVAWLPEERASLRPDHRIIRQVECVSGCMDVQFICDLRPDYGRGRPDVSVRGELGFFFSFGPNVVVLRGETDLTLQKDGTVSSTFTLKQGERVQFSLDYDQAMPAIVCPLGDFAEQQCQQTLEFWQYWAKKLAFKGSHRDVVLRSLITLKLLTQSVSGAIIAAGSCSLPEEIGGSRNWDYRYCWMRDAAFTLRALSSMGFADEARSFFDWLLHTVGLRNGRLHIVYDVFGAKTPSETNLDHLRGFAGSRPVRIGNSASNQFQLDIYGELLVAAQEYVHQGGELDSWQQSLLVNQGRQIVRHWQEPDAGIWEKRSENRRHTHSLLLCWCGLRALLVMNDKGKLKLKNKDKSQFKEVLEKVAATIESEGYNEGSGTYVDELGGKEVDAVLLKLALNGYVDAKDPKMYRTFERIEKELAKGPHLYRYKLVRGQKDGLQGQESAFFLCSLWAVEYLVLVGQIEAASTRLNSLIACTNDLGLASEEINPETAQLLGNFPQAFTHVGLINACERLRRALASDEDPRATPRGPRNLDQSKGHSC